MSTGSRKNMTAAMQKKSAETMARTMANRHGRRHTNRGRPRRACNYRPCKHQAHGKEARRRAVKAGPAQHRNATRCREVVIMPDWLIYQFYQEADIEETDQDQQYCCVTGEEARGEHYSSTP